MDPRMRSTFRQSLPPRVRGAVLLLALVCLVSHSGCSRPFFRQRADKEVAAILKEKDQFPDWKIEHYFVYPDPRSRFADPTNPDFPPMPPDDPAAKFLGPNPQKPRKAGVARIENPDFLAILQDFDAENRAQRLENAPRPAALGGPQPIGAAAVVPAQYLTAPQPELTAPQPVGQTPRAFLINLPQAVELGLINSREFQNRREDLYLSALPVTRERFAFASQFFFLEEAIRERTGSESISGAHNRWVSGSSTGFTKLFSTGALLLFRFANESVFELSGKGPHTTSISAINLDLVQPLLRGGGRAVTLEPLTLTERNLLYEIRGYARFRKEFFNAIAGGGDLGAASGIAGRISGAALVPGVIAASGLLARPLLPPSASGRLDLSVAPTPFSEGYLPTLLRDVQVDTERTNIRKLEYYLKLYRAYKEGELVSQLQVDQVYLQLLQAYSSILQREQDLRDSLDRFKLQLGLPVDVALELEDAPIRPMSDQLARYEAIPTQFKNTVESMFEEGGKDEKRGEDYFLKNPKELRGRLRETLAASSFVRGTDFQKRIRARLASWEPDKLPLLDLQLRVEKLREEARKLLAKKTDLELQGKSLSPADVRRLQDVEGDVAIAAYETTLRRYEAQPWDKKGLTDVMRRKQHADEFRQVRRDLTDVLSEARLERLEQLGQRWPQLTPVVVDGVDLLKRDRADQDFENDLDSAQALVTQTALANRLDLMNSRAQVVDAWRQIAIFANSLLGTFNVEYHMDSVTPPGQAKPLAFNGSRSRHQLVLNTELPLVRTDERNQYRASLIAYQRERRSLMAAEDRIAAAVRFEVRQLRVLADNYRIQQQAVATAYSVVENAEDVLFGAVDPRRKEVDAGTQAALTQQLLQALSRLLGTQNQLYAIWISYQTTRLQLYLDLELMPLDYRGVWTDELATPESRRGDGQPAGGNHQPGPGTERLGEPQRLPQPRPLTPAQSPPLE